ncbi:hypothetical protein BCR43DRAFT_450313 [Syncephalastrum racemosum]|uniref:Zn(2)-C6 fungal-type domain-containing protein n=1 Tax=Syncephalastrum racemosum TaxID=13706 RepID=A0A1X2HU73_SYNRA|nr:hypothetical protein BCR43DRAFT_450313 [Syncephalastrum racemosum]
MANESQNEHEINRRIACFSCRGSRHACDRRVPCGRCKAKGFECTYPDSAPSLRELQEAANELQKRVTCLQIQSDDIALAPSALGVTGFAIHPCLKCNHDLQHCDFKKPSCERCVENGYTCEYVPLEPKVNHLAQAVSTMNKVLDDWQHSMLVVPKRDKAYASAMATVAWKIISMPQGLSIETNVTSFPKLTRWFEHFRQSVSSTAEKDMLLHYPSTFKKTLFNVWPSCISSDHDFPTDYPIDITDDLTDTLIDLYCRTPCCSAIRMPIIDTAELLKRYRDPDPSKRPLKVLIYAVCGMAARNAFQLHVWSKKSKHQLPHYNIGKALSMAYCLLGRNQLAECFDEPSMDACQAAILLSYCSYQNGYPGVIYIYEFITFTMANELGLYDTDRELTPRESLLVWLIYYFNTWTRILQGGTSISLQSSQFFPRSSRPPKPPSLSPTDSPEPDEDYYVLRTWSYLIELQVQRDAIMAELCKWRDDGDKSDVQSALFKMQQQLADIEQRIPPAWRDPFSAESSSFQQACMLQVLVAYHTNRILLHYPFLSPDHIHPNDHSSYASLCWTICLNSACTVVRAMEILAHQCSNPIVNFLFTNIVFVKALVYNPNDKLARRHLALSLQISKKSSTYAYDFERARVVVGFMEQVASQYL